MVFLYSLSGVPCMDLAPDKEYYIEQPLKF